MTLLMMAVMTMMSCFPGLVDEGVARLVLR